LNNKRLKIKHLLKLSLFPQTYLVCLIINGEDLSCWQTALIDDVMMTGASLNALAKAVEAKGTAHVK